MNSKRKGSLSGKLRNPESEENPDIEQGLINILAREATWVYLGPTMWRDRKIRRIS